MAKKNNNKSNYTFPDIPSKKQWEAFVDDYVSGNLPIRDDGYQNYHTTVHSASDRSEAAALFHELCFSEASLEEFHEKHFADADSETIDKKYNLLSDVGLFLSALSGIPQKREMHHTASDHLAKKWCDFREKVTQEKHLEDPDKYRELIYAKKGKEASRRSEGLTRAHREACEPEKITTHITNAETGEVETNETLKTTAGNTAYRALSALENRIIYTLSANSAKALRARSGELTTTEEMISASELNLIEAMGTYKPGVCGFATHLTNRGQSIINEHGKVGVIQKRTKTNCTWVGEGRGESHSAGIIINGVDKKALKALDALINREDRDALNAALESLTLKEHKILSERFGLDGNEPKTLREIGAERGITHEAIRQTEAKIFKKLRKQITPDPEVHDASIHKPTLNLPDNSVSP